MEKVNIEIDGQKIECDKNLNVIEASAIVGTEIPHYCWRLGPCSKCQGFDN